MSSKRWGKITYRAWTNIVMVQPQQDILIMSPKPLKTVRSMMKNMTVRTTTLNLAMREKRATRASNLATIELQKECMP
jgi:hypothetical protein